MTTVVLSVLAFAALFAGYAVINRGREGKAGCGACHGGTCDRGPGCAKLE